MLLASPTTFTKILSWKRPPTFRPTTLARQDRLLDAKTWIIFSVTTPLILNLQKPPKPTFERILNAPTHPIPASVDFTMGTRRQTFTPNQKSESKPQLSEIASNLFSNSLIHHSLIDSWRRQKPPNPSLTLPAKALALNFFRLIRSWIPNA